MHMTTAQNDAIFLPGNLVVTAGAGSGKTRVLVERYIRLLTDVVARDPLVGASSLLAITFTEKAAREMRDRVRATVEARARAAPHNERPAWEACRAAVEAARIGTIHSFCAAVLRDHPVETGLDPQFTVLDEVETSILLTECVEHALGKAASTSTTLFEEYSPDELRTILLDMVRGGATVRAAVEALPTTEDDLRRQWDTRLVALKPRVQQDMLCSPAWCSAEDTVCQLASVAPTDDRIGSQVCQIAALLEAIANTATPQPPDIAPLVEALTTLDLRGGSKRAWSSSSSSAAHLASAKEALKTLRDTYRRFASLLNLEPDDETEQRAARAVLSLCQLYRAAHEHYTRRKTQQDALDFDDLVNRTRHLLETHADVRARWQAELSTVLVDEFQDTDNDQRAIIYALVGQADTPRPDTSLFVVGDGKQSIYRFRGADVSVFQRVEQDMVAWGGQAVRLNTSFRTHPPLLTWINQVTGTVLARERDLQPYEVAFEPLLPHRPDPTHSRCIELHCVNESSEPDQNSTDPTQQEQDNAPPMSVRDIEAQVIAERVRALVAGEQGTLVYDHTRECWRTPDYGDIALLFRASTAFEHYEQAFRTAGIPYLTTAGRSYYGRKEVLDMIHLLRVLTNPMDDLSLVGVLRSPLFALDDATLVRLRLANPHSLWDALMQPAPAAPTPDDDPPQPDDQRDRLTFARETLRDLYAQRGHLSVVQLLRHALAVTGYLATLSGLHDGDRRRANIEKLIESARTMTATATATSLSSFSLTLDALLQTETRESEAPLEAAGSVRLMTIHRSKGLEFPIVVLPDLGRGSPPNRNLWLAHRAYSMGVRLRNETGQWEDTAAYQMAAWEEQRMEQAEHERLLYVALTRARDYLILSGPVRKTSGSDFLSTMLQALGWPWEAEGPPAGPHGPLHVWRHDQTAATDPPGET